MPTENTTPNTTRISATAVTGSNETRAPVVDETETSAEVTQPSRLTTIPSKSVRSTIEKLIATKGMKTIIV